MNYRLIIMSLLCRSVKRRCFKIIQLKIIISGEIYGLGEYVFSQHGINRRDFMKLCAALSATMGLSGKAAAQMSKQ